MNPPSSSLKISVALCTCNGVEFIAEQIESICRQTISACEIVVRDDASTDDTVTRLVAAWEACRQAAPHATPVLRLEVNPRRLGVAQNFAAAMGACTGDWIALCDQDDRWHDDRLSCLVERIQAVPKADLLHSDARLIDSRGEPLGQTLFEGLRVQAAELAALQRGDGFNVLLDRNLVTGATVIFRKTLLAAALPIPSHWIHDEWLACLAAARSGLVVCREPWLDYRQHAANQIGVRPEGMLAAWQRALRPLGGDQAFRLIRARQLAERLAALDWPVPKARLGALHEKIRHHAIRADMPKPRWRRVLPVISELASGRYGRYGRGWKGAMSDLLAAG